MNANDLMKKLKSADRTRLRERTLQVWAAIYSHIQKEGSADIVEEDFVEYMTTTHGLSRRSLASHLRRMARAGLLDAHIMRRRADPATLTIARVMSLTQGMLPTQFYRYTLPDDEAPRHLTKTEKQLEDVLQSPARIDDTIATLDDIARANE